MTPCPAIEPTLSRGTISCYCPFKQLKFFFCPACSLRPDPPPYRLHKTLKFTLVDEPFHIQLCFSYIFYSSFLVQNLFFFLPPSLTYSHMLVGGWGGGGGKRKAFCPACSLKDFIYFKPSLQKYNLFLSSACLRADQAPVCSLATQTSCDS